MLKYFLFVSWMDQQQVRWETWRLGMPDCGSELMDKNKRRNGKDNCQERMKIHFIREIEREREREREREEIMLNMWIDRQDKNLKVERIEKRNLIYKHRLRKKSVLLGQTNRGRNVMYYLYCSIKVNSGCCCGGGGRILKVNVYINVSKSTKRLFPGLKCKDVNDTSLKS